MEKLGSLAKRVQKLYDSFTAGVPEDYRAGFAPEIVWHVPGNNPVSGIYRGADEYFVTMVDRMGPLDEWSLDVGRVLVNEGDQAALVEVRVRGRRKGVEIDSNGFHMIRIDEDGKIIEGWGFVEKQDLLDEFFSA